MKILIVNSAKGGVGKTEATTMLSIALKQMGNSVTILDLDVTTSNVKRIDGIDVITSPSQSEMTKSKMKRFIASSIKDAKQSGKDWLLIDTPPTISSAYVALTEAIKNPKIIYVTTPSENALIDTGKGVRFFASRGFVPVGVIQNMTGSHFGEAVDTEDLFNVETICSVPLLPQDTPPEERIQYFMPAVEKLSKLDFQSDIKDNIWKERTLSKITREEIERDPKIPLRFYNLKTWDIVRDKILEKEDMGNMGVQFMQSRFDISTDKIRSILESGDTATVMALDFYSIDNAPLPYEINEAKIIFDYKYSKGLPMLQLPSGVLLWANEVKVVSEHEIKETLDNGGIDLGEGRILPGIGTMLATQRIFSRGGQESVYRKERLLIDKYIEESKHNYSGLDLAGLIIALEENVDKISWTTPESIESILSQYREEGYSVTADHIEYIYKKDEVSAILNTILEDLLLFREEISGKNEIELPIVVEKQHKPADMIDKVIAKYAGDTVFSMEITSSTNPNEVIQEAKREIEKKVKEEMEMLMLDINIPSLQENVIHEEENMPSSMKRKR